MRQRSWEEDTGWTKNHDKKAEDFRE